VYNQVCDKELAKDLSKKLKGDGIDNYAKYAGKLKGEQLDFYIGTCADYYPNNTNLEQGNSTSPDGLTTIFLEDENMPYDDNIIHFITDDDTISFMMSYYRFGCWSEDSECYALIETDGYAGSGDESVLILCSRKENYVQVSNDDIFELDKEEYGKRKYVDYTNLIWSGKNTIEVEAEIDFWTSSGHPGIDEGLKNELGDDFGRSDPMSLGCIVISFK